MNIKKNDALLQSKNIMAFNLYDMDRVKYRQSLYSLQERDILSAKMLRLGSNLACSSGANGSLTY